MDMSDSIPSVANLALCGHLKWVSATTTPPWPEPVPRGEHDDWGQRYEVFQSVRRRSLLKASERDHGGNSGACSSSAADVNVTAA